MSQVHCKSLNEKKECKMSEDGKYQSFHFLKNIFQL